MIVVLTGGTGGAKLLRGLGAATSPRHLTVVANTGDDLEWWGLRVCPDLDSALYALAGCLDRPRGWGRAGETFHCLEGMRELGAETWFQLGDRDLATHLRRTTLLREGMPLSSATGALARALGVGATLLPMSDDPVRTELLTPEGWLSLEEFFVRERCRPVVREVAYIGAEAARPAPGVLDAIGAARAVVVSCSNPVTSIGPILAVPGIEGALHATPAPVIAVSPIVGGAPVSGPAGRLLQSRGLPVSATSVARLYQPWLDALLIDRRDAGLSPEIAALGVTPVPADTLMIDPATEIALAQSVLRAAGDPIPAA